MCEETWRMRYTVGESLVELHPSPSQPRPSQPSRVHRDLILGLVETKNPHYYTYIYGKNTCPKLELIIFSLFFLPPYPFENSPSRFSLYPAHCLCLATLLPFPFEHVHRTRRSLHPAFHVFCVSNFTHMLLSSFATLPSARTQRASFLLPPPRAFTTKSSCCTRELVSKFLHNELSVLFIRFFPCFAIHFHLVLKKKRSLPAPVYNEQFEHLTTAWCTPTHSYIRFNSL